MVIFPLSAKAEEELLYSTRLHVEVYTTIFMHAHLYLNMVYWPKHVAWLSVINGCLWR